MLIWGLSFQVTSKGRFTLWTMKLDQGVVRTLIGCWTRPETTSVCTKEKMAEGPWRSRSPKYNFEGIINAMKWSNRFCGERRRQGPMANKCRYNTFLVKVFLVALYTTLPTRWDLQGTLFNMYMMKSWEASPPSICLDHIIAHDTYCFFHALPFKLSPTCFIKQCGTSRTQEFECIFFFFWSTN